MNWKSFSDSETPLTSEKGRLLGDPAGFLLHPSRVDFLVTIFDEKLNQIYSGY